MLFTKMTNPLVFRILSSSINVSKQAAVIIRDIMKGGELAVVEKVFPIHTNKRVLVYDK